MFQVGSEFKDYLAFKATEFGQAVKIAATQLIEQETSEQSRFLQNSRLQSKLENVNILLDAIKHFNKNWVFRGSMEQRFCERARFPGEEEQILMKYLEAKRSVVIFPSTKMGPDLIFLEWDKEQPLVIEVQCRSGLNSSTPDALLSLQQLYQEKTVANNEFVKQFETLLKESKCLVALVVVKPMRGSHKIQGWISKSATLEIETGKLVFVIEKDSSPSLMPSLQNALDILREYKDQSY